MAHLATVLFIGLGRMGLPLAQRLAAAGIQVKGWDRDAETMRRWRDAAGAEALQQELDSPQADAVFLCLPTPQAAADMLGRWSREPGMQAPLVVDLGTTPPSMSRSFAAHVRGLGAEYLDAPVTGGTTGAASGRMAMMVGGTPEAFARARPLLERLAAPVLHVGPSGTGSQLKAVVQFVYLSYNAAFALGLQLAQDAGLPAEPVLEVLRSGASAHPLIEARLDGLQDPASTARFLVWRALKDLRCIEDRARLDDPGRRWLESLEAVLAEAGEKHGNERDMLEALAPSFWPARPAG